MLVKTISGHFGRIDKSEKGGINIAVQMLNKNLQPLKNGKGQKVIEYHKACNLIYNPKIIVQL